MNNFQGGCEEPSVGRLKAEGWEEEEEEKEGGNDSLDVACSAWEETEAEAETEAIAFT